MQTKTLIYWSVKLRRVELLMKLHLTAHSYGMSLAIWDHTVLTSIQHK